MKQQSKYNLNNFYNIKGNRLLILNYAFPNLEVTNSILKDDSQEGESYGCYTTSCLRFNVTR